MSDQAELVIDCKAELGEGPTWDVESQLLWWVDILAGAVNSFRPTDGATTTFTAPSHVGSVALRRSRGFMLALQDGFWLSDPASNVLRRVAAVEAEDKTTRMNDGKCDSTGRFWAGTMSYDTRLRRGALYRLDPSGNVEKVLAGVGISNGLGWSLDDSIFYYVDSLSHGVDSFDFHIERGSVSHRQRLVTIKSEVGLPDGLTIDADGFLWVAIWGGGVVHRYSPGGKLDGIVRIPVRQVTSCTFGGSDLGDLYVTTAAQGLSGAQLAVEPTAGGIFRYRPGVTGLPAAAFAG